MSSSSASSPVADAGATPTYSKEIPNVSSTAGVAPTSAKNKASFPPAAIAVLAILLGIAALFAAYKLYRWIYMRVSRKKIEATYPEPKADLPPPMMYQHARPQSSYSSFGRNSTLPLFAQHDQRRSSSLMAEDKFDAVPPSPIYPDGGTRTPSPTGMHLPRPALRSDSRMSMSPSFTDGPGSAGGPRRSFYGPNAVIGSSPMLHSASSSSFGSKLPHDRNSKVALNLVMPEPLGAAPGNVVAKDKSTLDFAPDSGVGGPQQGDWFAGADGEVVWRPVDGNGSRPRPGVVPNPIFDGHRGPPSPRQHLKVAESSNARSSSITPSSSSSGSSSVSPTPRPSSPSLSPVPSDMLPSPMVPGVQPAPLRVKTERVDGDDLPHGGGEKVMSPLERLMQETRSAVPTNDQDQ